MDILLEELQLPAVPQFNYEELKTQISEICEQYETAIFDDVEIKKAKSTRAELNAVKKGLNDARIQKEKEYMKPFNEFKAKVDDIISILDKPIKNIDSQIKDYEARMKEDKQIQINAIWEKKMKPDWLQLSQIQDPKWLNASTSLKSIEEDIDMNISTILFNFDSLENLEHSLEAQEIYKKNLSLSEAMAEDSRLREVEKKRAEIEAVKEEAKKMDPEELPFWDVEETEKEDVHEEPKEWMKIKICMNSADFDKFERFAADNNISWEIEF